MAFKLILELLDLLETSPLQLDKTTTTDGEGENQNLLLSELA